MRVLLPILFGFVLVTMYPAWVWDPKAQDDSDVQVTDLYFGIELEESQAVLGLLKSIGEITVATWEEDDAAVRDITVKQDAEKGWVIASRFDYPADGKDRLGKTIAQVLGIKRGREVAADKRRHGSLGVLDPTEAGTLEEGDERGKRVTVKDGDGGVMVDLVVGKRVDGQQGQYYVRELDDDKVFIAEIVAPDPEDANKYRVESISSHFIDWVEANPLDLKKDDVRELAVENYSIDSDTMQLKDHKAVGVSKPAGADKWTMEALPAGKEINTDEVDKILNRVTYLRLADVAKRLGLGQQELLLRGFFPTAQGLFGKQGAIRVGTKEGLTYHIFFGDIAGTVTKGGEGTAEAPADDAGESDRLMFVALSPYVPADDETMPKAPLAQEVPADADPAKKAEIEDANRLAREGYLKKKEEHIAQQKKKVDELNARYTSFFYVVRDGDFQTLRPDVERLLKDAPEPETPAAGDQPAAGDAAGPGASAPAPKP